MISGCFSTCHSGARLVLWFGKGSEGVFGILSISYVLPRRPLNLCDQRNQNEQLQLTTITFPLENEVQVCCSWTSKQRGESQDLQSDSVKALFQGKLEHNSTPARRTFAYLCWTNKIMFLTWKMFFKCQRFGKPVALQRLNMPPLCAVLPGSDFHALSVASFSLGFWKIHSFPFAIN